MIKIIFCALNEAQNLTNLLKSIDNEMLIVQHDYEIIICLDGSDDESFEILSNLQSKYPVKILPLLNQRGLGLAYKRLFLNVLTNSNDDDIIISLDADNTHNPNQIQTMIKHLKNNDLDVLIASRFCKNSVMADFPIYRKFISSSISVLFQILFALRTISGNKLKDFTSGYRLYKAKKLRELLKKEGNNLITEPEFTYTCELLIKLSRIEAKFDEISISYDYGKKIGASKLRIGRNFWRLIILLFKLAK